MYILSHSVGVIDRWKSRRIGVFVSPQFIAGQVGWAEVLLRVVLRI